ncbi:MAG: NAD(FAD)-utilizing dehydrogenase, partial [Clostridiales bacterium]|nr:NAD(FAD)-utilizing dehydrogenase [Clostridiales bacterium]
MKYRISEIKTEITEEMSALPKHISRRTGIRVEDISSWEIRRRSTDSRKKPHIYYVYTVDFVTRRKLKPSKIRGLTDITGDDGKVLPPEPGCRSTSADRRMKSRPVVCGMGPCGLFAGLELAKMGYDPIIIERGPEMGSRIDAVERFRKDRVLDPEANMLFGEGGAGTFSDGK